MFWVKRLPYSLMKNKTRVFMKLNGMLQIIQAEYIIINYQPVKPVYQKGGFSKMKYLIRGVLCALTIINFLTFWTIPVPVHNKRKRDRL